MFRAPSRYFSRCDAKEESRKLEKMSDSFSNFLAQAAAYVVEHKMWFMVGGGVLVGAVVLGLIIAAAAGAFAPAQTLVPVPEFDIVSITDSAGAADTNASVIGTYAQIEVSAYAGPQVAGEQIVAAWMHGTEKYVTYAKVTATGKYVTHVVSVANGVLFSTDPAGFAARAPLEGTVAWSRVKASTTSTVGPRTIVFQAPATVALLRMARAVGTNWKEAARAVHKTAVRAISALPAQAGKTSSAQAGKASLAKEGTVNRKAVTRTAKPSRFAHRRY
jgi:hypothetical protein